MNKGKCHFIGIGGIGMSGLAKLLLQRNVEVSGSDMASSYVTEGLIKQGAKIAIGHSTNNITSDMTVVYTTGVSKENPEFKAASEMKCPMLHRSDLLMQLMTEKKSLAVAGTHGKTTTSALLTTVLSHAGLDPSFAVGGQIPQLKTNASHGSGSFFVAEACESDGTFLKYHPHGAIITNIDFDHMDYYGTETALIRSFQTFMTKVLSQELLFWCGDDPRLVNLSMPGISYGFGPNCTLRITKFQQKGWKICFDVAFMGKNYSNIEIPIIGRHNALNSLAVFGLALSIGVPEEKIRKAFKEFKGVGRRCEVKGEVHNILALDDYAHHPTEIKTTLAGIREAIGERRLIAVYQPHRYSRTKDCLGKYQHVFDSADEVVITDIYAAGEAPIPGITHLEVLTDIRRSTLANVQYVQRDHLTTFLEGYLRPHDVLVTIGAGDITKLGGEVVEKLKRKNSSKIRVGVIFGGVSVEHEISLMSARHIASSLNKECYEIEYFGITKTGRWVAGARAENILKNGELIVEEPTEERNLLTPEVMKRLLECDILFPVLHGTFGEDGTIQGFFEILGKPYVGCDHRSSAISMDKAMTKSLMVLHGIPTLPFLTYSKNEWTANQEIIHEEIFQKFDFPFFVKPTHLGSSVGVYKVEKKDQIGHALFEAFKVDTHVIIEKGIHVREIEFAVLGNDKVEVFPPGEILANGRVYDYDGKYGPNSIGTTPQAQLTTEQIEEGMQIARKAYMAVGCKGMARIDTFLDQEGNFWINEINPIPGFTKISLYPKICEVNGFSAKELMDRLIVLGLHAKQQQKSCLNYMVPT